VDDEKRGHVIWCVFIQLVSQKLVRDRLASSRTKVGKCML